MTTNSPTRLPLRMGVLGCANIAKQFIRDVKPSSSVTVVAAASRNLATATAFAQEQGLERAYGSYEELLSAADIDAIYLPLPNSMHCEWAVKAAQSGKHILCEKPLALGAEEAQRMFDAARQQRVMLIEAYPYYFQPQTALMLSLITDGSIGEVRLVQASFGFALANAGTNIRMKPELGGGALLDAGSYALSLIRLVMGCAPQSVHADSTWTDTGVDISTMATLHYADGRRAQMSCAMDTANHRRAVIAGTLGTLETEYLNHTSAEAGKHAVGYLPSELRVRRGTANSVPFEVIASDVGSGFLFAAEAFAKMVVTRDEAAFERSAQVSLDNASVMEAIGRSARAGSAVRL